MIASSLSFLIDNKKSIYSFGPDVCLAMLSQHVHQIPTIHVLVLVPFRPHTEHQEAADATRVSQEVNLMRQPAVSHHALLALGSIAPIQSTTAWIQHRQAHWHGCRFKEC